MRVWFVDDADLTEPKEVTAASCEWPEKDSDGRTIYEGTHFAELDHAWHALVQLQRECIQAVVTNLENARETVRIYEHDLADRRAALQRTEDNRQRYLERPKAP